jgi:hypothetical protein
METLTYRPMDPADDSAGFDLFDGDRFVGAVLDANDAALIVDAVRDWLADPFNKLDPRHPGVQQIRQAPL